MNIKMFVEQHEELLNIAGEISKSLDAEKLTSDAEKVKKLWIKLLGKLTVHLKLEDEWLYPQLQDHSDENIRAMAKRFVDEMGGIGQAVTVYKEKWIVVSSAIKNDPSGFITETKGIFEALANRIDKENNELYKSVENIQ